MEPNGFKYIFGRRSFTFGESVLGGGIARFDGGSGGTLSMVTQVVRARGPPSRIPTLPRRFGGSLTLQRQCDTPPDALQAEDSQEGPQTSDRYGDITTPMSPCRWGHSSGIGKRPPEPSRIPVRER